MLVFALAEQVAQDFLPIMVLALVLRSPYMVSLASGWLSSASSMCICSSSSMLLLLQDIQWLRGRVK
ncbi:hypothetical protein [Chitinimonas prasina]|uniref:hypothetical protein n=1 Tax=Chitinimonas prasina TaxID=1434937 RepID=UPI0024E0F6D7|nr:hypothetical protein [Chitinimonas prasina]